MYGELLIITHLTIALNQIMRPLIKKKKKQIMRPNSQISENSQTKKETSYWTDLR